MSRTWMLLGLLAALAGPAVASPAESGEAETKTAVLRHRAPRASDVVLPAERFAPVGASIDVAGRRFPVRLDGLALEVDVDADGTFDVRAAGASARVVLAGATGAYAVRLRNDGTGWTWAAGGEMTGEVAGTRVRIIDQDGDGTYDDYGADAIVVGRGRVATFLSRTINVDGKLWAIDVAADGASVRWRPYDGPAGSLKLDYQTRGKVLGLVVKSTDGAHSFDLARAGEGLLVPAGTYELARGQIGLGETRVEVRAGRAGAVLVKDGATTELVWGGPVKAEFGYVRTGGEVALSPADIRYFGSAGEEYVSWFPDGKSPRIVITHGKTGREIAEAYFPGSC